MLIHYQLEKGIDYALAPIPAVAGVLTGRASRAYGEVKLGSWLKGTPGGEGQKAVGAACAKFGIKSGEDLKQLPAEKQRQFAKTLGNTKKKAAGVSVRGSKQPFGSRRLGLLAILSVQTL
ncbi:MAG: hypothetical protein NZ578_08805 [Candidatus Binatia bacterium]|nr:hypothetical protein [Candidatus Binatia bacterium]